MHSWTPLRNESFRSRIHNFCQQPKNISAVLSRVCNVRLHYLTDLHKLWNDFRSHSDSDIQKQSRGASSKQRSSQIRVSTALQDNLDINNVHLGSMGDSRIFTKVNKFNTAKWSEHQLSRLHSVSSSEHYKRRDTHYFLVDNCLQ